MNSTKPNNCYFLPYLKYKMRENRVAVIIFAILNFLALIVPCAIILYAINIVKNKNKYDIVWRFDPEVLPIMVLLLFSAIVTIIFLIVSARSFKYYYNRAMMDTLGCLPLSYKDRFWGDYFGGLLSNMISFVPFFVISFILTFIFDLIDNGSEQINPNIIVINDSTSYLSENFRKMLISLFIMYVAVHAVTVFITSCCGRFGTSILFSAVTMFAIPGIYVVYGMVGFSDLVGIEPLELLADHVGMFPPFGEVFSQIMRKIITKYSLFDNFESKVDFAIDSAFNVIVIILIIAAFIAGAYFIGKRRKAERVEQGFVFNMSLYVVTIVISVLVIGFALYYFPRGYELDKMSVIKAAGLSFVLFIGLELSQKKSFKGIWKSLIRYVFVFGISFGFLTLMRATRGFGEEGRVPVADAVSEVRIEGDYFIPTYHDDGIYVLYKEKNSVSSIVDIHKKILENSEKLHTGDMLEITYRMKNGNKMIRHYSCRDEDIDLIKGFSTEIKHIDEEAIDYGVVGEPIYDGINIRVVTRKDKQDEIYYVRPEKFEEFYEVLKNDLKYNYHAHYRNTYGDVTFRNNEDKFLDHYPILHEYTDTITFIENPENVITAEEYSIVENKGIRYQISFGIPKDDRTYGYTFHITVNSNDDSAAVQKLIGLISERDISDGDEYYRYVWVYSSDIAANLVIKKEDAEEAVEALIEIVRRQALR